MTDKDIVQEVFEEFGRSLQGKKRRRTYFLHGKDATVVVNLQKSQYGPQYYVNLMLWFGDDDNPYPKHGDYHTTTRLGRLVPAEKERAVKDLLDLETPISDGDRRTRLRDVFDTYLAPAVAASGSFEGLATRHGKSVLQRSLITRVGRRILGAKPELGIDPLP